MVTFTDIARLAVELGFAESLTRQGVRKMAETDPNWPVPREQWLKIGNAWAMPWPPIREYLAGKTFQGRGPDLRPRQRRESPAPEE